MGVLRVSSISFLNTAPLMWDFEHGKAEGFEISYTVPSLCAESLRAGSADIGIIPVAAYASIPNLLVVPGVSIASRGPVRSILLVSKVPMEQVKTIAADKSSRTSVALCRVLFRKWVGGRREYMAMEPNLRLMLEEHDAALLIGDPALEVERSHYICWDLGEEWQRRTGKPFVFAFWAVRAEALRAHDLDFARIFQQSRDHGLAHIDEIAQEWAPRTKLPEHDIQDYLRRNVDYSLDAGNLDGLDLFFRLAVETGVLSELRAVEFLPAHEHYTNSAKTG